MTIDLWNMSADAKHRSAASEAVQSADAVIVCVGRRPNYVDVAFFEHAIRQGNAVVTALATLVPSRDASDPVHPSRVSESFLALMQHTVVLFLDTNTSVGLQRISTFFQRLFDEASAAVPYAVGYTSTTALRRYHEAIRTGHALGHTRSIQTARGLRLLHHRLIRTGRGPSPWDTTRSSPTALSVRDESTVDQYPRRDGGQGNDAQKQARPLRRPRVDNVEQRRGNGARDRNDPGEEEHIGIAARDHDRGGLVYAQTKKCLCDEQYTRWALRRDINLSHVLKTTGAHANMISLLRRLSLEHATRSTGGGRRAPSTQRWGWPMCFASTAHEHRAPRSPGVEQRRAGEHHMACGCCRRRTDTTTTTMTFRD